MTDTHRDLAVEINRRDWNADGYAGAGVSPISKNPACAGKRLGSGSNPKMAGFPVPVAIPVSATSCPLYTSIWTASGHTARVQASVGSHQRARYGEPAQLLLETADVGPHFRVDKTAAL
jgi:hypothetical protein